MYYRFLFKYVICFHGMPATTSSYIRRAWAPELTVTVVYSCKEGFIVGGILLGYLASALWVGETGGWRYMYGAALPPALLVFVGMVSQCPASFVFAGIVNQTWVLHGLFFFFLQAWLPESPRWLLLSGGTRERAEGAVRRAWGASADSQAVQQEVANMMRDNPATSSGTLTLKQSGMSFV